MIEIGSAGVLERALTPALMAARGPEAELRYLEFLTAHIRNRNTRLAYAPPTLPKPSQVMDERDADFRMEEDALRSRISMRPVHGSIGEEGAADHQPRAAPRHPRFPVAQPGIDLPP